ncbi:MAG: M3 family oligoendopeptidase [Christensenellales bacterium]
MKWDLSRLYRGFDDENFARDIQAVESGYASLLRDTVALSDAKGLSDILRGAQQAMSLLYKTFSYTQLTLAADAGDERARMLIEKLSALTIGHQKLMSALSAYLADKDLAQYAEADALLKEHAYLLTLLKRDAAHVLDPAIEDTVLRMQLTGGVAFNQLRDQLDAQHLIELGGEKHPLSKIRGMAYSADADVRRRAYEAEIAAYPAIESPMAACLNAIKGETLTILPLRNYESALDASLDSARMDRKTLDALIGAMQESLPAFRRFLRAKARNLGYAGGLKFYDLFAPLGASAREYTLDEAREMLRDVFTDFSPKMAAFIDKTFDENLVDAYPRAGKVGGAFCASVHPLGVSYILSNFDGSLSSVSTLAHELGHAYHSDCIMHLSVLLSDYPMPLAETASIFSETLLVNRLLADADADTRMTLLDQQLTDAAQVIVDILSRYLFETEVFDRRKDHVLTPKELCAIMTDAQEQTYGDGLDASCMHPYMWACKSHYYMVDYHFYNFPYAFGLLFGMGVYAQYLEKGAAFLPMYDALLASTSTGDVRDVAAGVGIDVTDIDFWRGSIRVLTERIDEFERL